MQCIDENQLLAFADGRLRDEELSAVEVHLDSCPTCQEALALLQPLNPSSASAPLSQNTRAPLARGAAIGRYMVLHALGRGGMGVVYTAYDPELERKVALKVVRPSGFVEAGANEGATRLRREAQVLARLSHPNVIAVYDVGTFDEQLFIAMELVDGVTLAEWLGKNRSYREVLGAFLQAGRGLCAAHAAGVIHRDFKPSNALMGKDGRVRVLDFGLARANADPADARDAERGTSPGLSTEVPSGGADSADRLTRTGALLGTPAYMAPEQRAGQTPDARADQYSFCVALTEALYGDRPSTPEAPLPPRAQNGRVPAPVRRALQRGLSANPEARYPTLDALLDALDRGQGRVRRVAVGVSLLLLLTAAGGLRIMHHRRAMACEGFARSLAGVWDEPRRIAMRRRFHDLGLSYAADAFDGAARLLDRFALEWRTMLTESCQATHVRGEQSEELLALRSSCLTDRLGALRATTDLLLEADRDVVTHAAALVTSLPPVSTCATTNALRMLEPLPKNLTERNVIETLSLNVARALAYKKAGRYREAMTRIRPLVEEAHRVGYRPLEAEALTVRGALECDLGDDEVATKTLLAAMIAGEQGGDVHTGVQARLGYAHALDTLGRWEEAVSWIDLADAELRRAGDDPLLEARLLGARGVYLSKMGRYEEARRAAERVLEIRKRVLGPEHREVGWALLNLGTGLQSQGRYAEALSYYRQAYDVLKIALGPSHPELAGVLMSMGAALGELDRRSEAVGWMERAVALELAGRGEDHPAVADRRMNLGMLYRWLGALDKAEVQQREVIRIYEKKFGANYPALSWPLVERGLIDLARNDPRRAVPFLERASTLQPQSERHTSEIKFALARALWGYDQPRAKQLIEAALHGYDPKNLSDKEMIAEIIAFRSAHPADRKKP
jgi:tetratricopeptide (TPR) repeat protein/predicted Ser/Thr protein kinase